MNTKTVTSLTNTTVKAVRALHMRKEREESGLFLAEEPEDRHRGDRLRSRAQDRDVRPRRRRPSDAEEGRRRLREGYGGEVIEVNREILEKVFAPRQPAGRRGGVPSRCSRRCRPSCPRARRAGWPCRRSATPAIWAR
ncbi:hypothetical protein ACRAWD_19295 [Caulobacter segnis]